MVIACTAQISRRRALFALFLNSSSAARGLPAAAVAVCLGVRERAIVLQIVRILAIFVAIAGTAEAGLAQGRPAAVEVDAVRESEISDTRPVIGRLVASVRSQIASRIVGVAQSVTFKVGDRVSRGQVLVYIDTTLAEIEKRSAMAARHVAQAGVEVAEAKLKLAQQTFERQSQLRGSTAFSRSRFEDLRQAMAQARSELAQAKAAVGSTTAQIARAEYTLTNAAIAAPFDGVVIARSAQPGQYVQLGSAVATLLDTSNLEIDADVPTSLVGGLKTGQKVPAHFDAGPEAIATVRAIVPVDNLSTRTRSVRFSVDLSKVAQDVVATGKTLTLAVPASVSRKVLTVSKDALVQAGTGWMVFVATSNKAEPRPISIGQSVSERVEVTSGLKAGELVVVRGNERLRPGQPLKTHRTHRAGPARRPNDS
jgi:RND family efflux transporter MFP subunit